MSPLPGDLARRPDLEHPRGAGPIRTRRPVYLDLLPPCNHACPAGESIQAWLALAAEERFEEAWRVIVRANPLPAVHGRVCYHPCETACNREPLDGAVSIHAVERFLGDRALEMGWTVSVPPPTGKRVLVVGAGPAGLSAAWHLALLGHQVEVRDAGPVAGGMLHFGIPAYRLPRDVLAGEVARIEALGVRIRLDHRVEDLLAEKEEGGFDAVFVAVGAHLSRRVEIPAMDSGRILDALTLLRSVQMGEPPRLGRRVAIYGGGNTAMDAARTVLRLGHEPVIVYRRTRERMPAHDFELEEALEEGVRVRWLRSIRSMEEGSLTVEEMELDEGGRPRSTGRFETLAADDLILALGQETDTRFLQRVPGVETEADGTVRVSPELMTGHPGIFAGGDMVPAERTVTVAVGHGRQAARHIDAWLRGERLGSPDPPPLATLETLNLWFFTDVQRRPQPRAGFRQRQRGFREVVGGLGPGEALAEARRCFSCGVCFECDGCLAACPEDAVIKLGKGLRYRFDYDRCTGCEVCFRQCPSGAISMVPESMMPEPAGREPGEAVS